MNPPPTPFSLCLFNRVIHNRKLLTDRKRVRAALWANSRGSLILLAFLSLPRSVSAFVLCFSTPRLLLLFLRELAYSRDLFKLVKELFTFAAVERKGESICFVSFHTFGDFFSRELACLRDRILLVFSSLRSLSLFMIANSSENFFKSSNFCR